MDAARAIYGIDFSGAKDAGSRIWIAKGIDDGRKLLVSECFGAKDLPNSGKRIEDCLPAVVELISSSQDAVFGFDFPFGLPAPLVHDKTWEDFVLEFPKRYRNPEAFRESCRQKMPSTELKRKTDTEAQTPFSPYNLWLYKQTYYGISKVLHPLVRDKSACVLPFHKTVQGKPWILEVCPASTLKDIMKNKVPPYKGSEGEKEENRREILDIVMKAGVAIGSDAALNDKIIANKGGDALDSVIAALAVFNTMQTQSWGRPAEYEYLMEGFVYH